MEIKQYKVKYENGEIKPQEVIDVVGNHDATIVFFITNQEKPKDFHQDLTPLKNFIGVSSEKPSYGKLTPELIEKELYGDQ